MKKVLILLAITIACQAQAQKVSITSYASAAPELILCSQEGDSLFIAWQSDYCHQQVFFRNSETEDWIEGCVTPLSMYFTTVLRVKNAAILYWRICSGNTSGRQECVEGSAKVASTDSVDEQKPPHHHPCW